MSMRQSDLEHQQLSDLPEDQDRSPGRTVGYGGPRDGNRKRNNTVMTNRMFTIVSPGTRVSPANDYRNYLLIYNSGAQNVFVSFGSSANSVSGVTVEPGGNYEPWVIPSNDVYVSALDGSPSTIVLVEGYLKG